ncbi:MAG: hypothetical protein WC850_05105 [Candidatus Gracilibacteria bacterium]
MTIPVFKIYGEGNSEIENKIRGDLSLKSWINLSEKDKQNIILNLEKKGWIDQYSDILVKIGNYFNEKYMSIYPFRKLNSIIPEIDYSRPNFKNEYNMKSAAYNDFKYILLFAQEDLVYKVISMFANELNERHLFRLLTDKSTTEDINKAFEKFDRFCNWFNHISEQYSLNLILTREGFIPKQEEVIINNIYIPTISLLQNPKWLKVDKLLIKVFEDFQNKSYSSVISGSHNVLQKFLQIFLGEKEENGKGAFGKYFSEFKKNEKLNNQFTNGILTTTQSFLSSERAEKSDAKPGKKEPTLQDALLVMNTSLVFINFCLISN